MQGGFGMQHGGMQHSGAGYAIKGEDERSAFLLDATTLVITVVDGHGGANAARLCKRLLEGMLTADTADTASLERCDWAVRLERAFATLHAECLRLPCCSGAALTVCVVDTATGRVTCANVGDAGALLVSPTSHLWLSTSHRLQDNAQERERLRAHVGTLHTGGPPRLYPGGLACGRSIGDADCPYVTCAPAVATGTRAAAAE